MNNSDFFNKALHDMVFENACGAAIRRLADMSFPVSYIHSQLDYPISFAQVQNYVWKYYLEKKILLYLDSLTSYQTENEYILLNGQKKTKSFIKEQGPYGKISYRQIIVDENDTANTNSIMKYIPCDFGIIKYENPSYWKELLNKLDTQDRDYISDLLWPKERIYHIMNKRMSDIVTELEKSGLKTIYD